MLSKRGLAVTLSQLLGFANPDERLEQYATDSEVAAELLWHALMKGDLKGKRVADLGAGTGVLAIGAALLGASVTAVEKEKGAIATLKENAARAGTKITILHEEAAMMKKKSDTIIMNPPFGTRERHADTEFLERALALAPEVYTIHKTSTEEHIEGVAERHGFTIAWKARRQLPLKQTMAHHTRRIKRVKVTLYHLSRRMAERGATPGRKGADGSEVGSDEQGGKRLRRKRRGGGRRG